MRKRSTEAWGGAVRLAAEAALSSDCWPCCWLIHGLISLMNCLFQLPIPICGLFFFFSGLWISRPLLSIACGYSHSIALAAFSCMLTVPL